MRESIQNITRDLFSLRLVKNEDPHAPHIEETLKRLEQNTKLFESNLHSFAYGGQIKSVDGATTEVEHLTGKELEVLSAAQREWSSYDQKLRSYLMSARDISVNTALLDAVTEEAQNANNTIYTAVNALTERITQRTINRMQMMKTIQIGGVAVLLSYWIIFIFFFARRLQVFDTESRDARRETQEILQTVKDGLFLAVNILPPWKISSDNAVWAVKIWAWYWKALFRKKMWKLRVVLLHNYSINALNPN